MSIERKPASWFAMIARLHCPYCGSDLKLTNGRTSNPEQPPSYGVLSCSCNSYPIIAGIPVIQHIEGLSEVVSHIQKNETQKALLQALSIFRIKWAHKSRWHQLRYRLNCQKLVTDNNLRFEQVVELVRKPKVFSDYLFHRYANTSFLAAVGVMQVFSELPAPLAGERNRILDIACGAGHSSFILQKLHPEVDVVSVDQDFISLYLSKRFMAGDGIHICLDAEAPSAFPDDSFQGVFCLDAFHYFRSKKAIAGEFKRISVNDAICILPHLHNSLQTNITAGIPLPPKGYLDCFDLSNTRVFDETKILHSMCKDGILDLTQSPAIADLEKAPTLTLISGPKRIWKVHQAFPSILLERNLKFDLNPIYRKKSGSGHEFELRWPNEVMQRECNSVEAILPETVQFKDNEYLANGKINNDKLENIKDLVRKFILVALPDGYTSNKR